MAGKKQQANRLDLTRRVASHRPTLISATSVLNGRLKVSPKKRPIFGGGGGGGGRRRPKLASAAAAGEEDLVTASPSLPRRPVGTAVSRRRQFRGAAVVYFRARTKTALSLSLSLSHVPLRPSSHGLPPRWLALVAEGHVCRSAGAQLVDGFHLLRRGSIPSGNFEVASEKARRRRSRSRSVKSFLSVLTDRRRCVSFPF